MDGADYGCDDASDADETDPSTGCNDGRDNDGDGWTDLADPDCPTPVSTGGEVGYDGSYACNDSVDNDGREGADARDPDCVDGYDTSEAG